MNLTARVSVYLRVEDAYMTETDKCCSSVGILDQSQCVKRSELVGSINIDDNTRLLKPYSNSDVIMEWSFVILLQLINVMQCVLNWSNALGIKHRLHC